MTTCRGCGGRGDVPATPGRPGDGPMPCPDCADRDRSRLQARIATVNLTFANGRTLLRSYRIGEPWPGWIEEPPEFLSSLRKEWPTPSEPVRFSADVAPGFEQEARDLLRYETA